MFIILNVEMINKEKQTYTDIYLFHKECAIKQSKRNRLY